MNTFIYLFAILVLIFLNFIFLAVLYFWINGLMTIPWIRTRSNMARRMLELAGFEPGKRVLDLGCGDGSILFEAVRMKGEGIGIERLRLLVWYTRFIVKLRGLEGNISIRQGNIFSEALPQADVVTCYLFPNVNRRLEPRLREVFPPGTRVVSRDFLFPTLREICAQRCGQSVLRLYEI